MMSQRSHACRPPLRLGSHESAPPALHRADTCQRTAPTSGRARRGKGGGARGRGKGGGARRGAERGGERTSPRAEARADSSDSLLGKRRRPSTVYSISPAPRNAPRQWRLRRANPLSAVHTPSSPPQRAPAPPLRGACVPLPRRLPIASKAQVAALDVGRRLVAGRCTARHGPARHGHGPARHGHCLDSAAARRRSARAEGPAWAATDGEPRSAAAQGEAHTRQ